MILERIYKENRPLWYMIRVGRWLVGFTTSLCGWVAGLTFTSAVIIGVGTVLYFALRAQQHDFDQLK